MRTTNKKVMWTNLQTNRTFRAVKRALSYIVKTKKRKWHDQIYKQVNIYSWEKNTFLYNEGHEKVIWSDLQGNRTYKAVKRAL